MHFRAVIHSTTTHRLLIMDLNRVFYFLTRVGGVGGCSQSQIQVAFLPDKDNLLKFRATKKFSTDQLIIVALYARVKLHKYQGKKSILSRKMTPSHFTTVHSSISQAADK